MHLTFLSNWFCPNTFRTDNMHITSQIIEQSMYHSMMCNQMTVQLLCVDASIESLKSAFSSPWLFPWSTTFYFKMITPKKGILHKILLSKRKLYKIKLYLSLCIAENNSLSDGKSIIKVSQSLKFPFFFFHGNKKLLDALSPQKHNKRRSSHQIPALHPLQVYIKLT